VRDLKPNATVHIRLRVLAKGTEKLVRTRTTSNLKVCPFDLGDETGMVQYSAFADDVDKMAKASGKVIDINDGWVRYWDGHLQISRGKKGTWLIVEDPTFPDANACQLAGKSSYTINSPKERIETVKGDLYKVIWDEKNRRKIARAFKMIANEKNVMVVHREWEKIMGVVRSQRTPTKVQYATQLDSDGNYWCYSNDIEPCKGMDGTICKHILLTLIGVVKEDLIPMEEIRGWLKKAVFKKPGDDVERARWIFDNYQLLKVENVEWRPIELMPEDFMGL
nr:hypothetical protein [Candidatus Sigynarchaeota archaeon]